MRCIGLSIRRKKTSSSGFSLIEVMFAIAILAVGLCALMAMFASATYSVQYAQEDQICKQKAREALEAAIAARNDTSITFDNLQNVSQGGIFKDGFQNLYVPKSDGNGIPGTANGDSTTLDRFVQPGPDGVLGTNDDTVIGLTNYQRRIAIASVYNSDGSLNNDLRKITVTVRVMSPVRGNKDFTISSFISRFN